MVQHLFTAFASSLFFLRDIVDLEDSRILQMLFLVCLRVWDINLYKQISRKPSQMKLSTYTRRYSDYHIYRVAGLSCPEAGGCKSAILRGFPNVFSLFGPCKVGGISFRYSWTTGMKKKFRNLVLKKGQISGFAQIDIFLISNFFGYLSITFFKTIQM